MIDVYQEYEQESIQQLPFSREAEQAVIGAILQNHELIHDIPATLTHDAFYEARHRRIYQAIEQLVTDGRKVDIIDLAEILSRSGDDRNGGDLLGYMSDLAMNTPGANVAVYSKIVLSRHLDRSIIAAGIQLSRLGYEPGEAEDKITAAMEAVTALSSGESVSAKDFNALLKQSVERLDRRFRGNEPLGLDTGFREIDDMVRFRNGNLIIVAGRPGQGKTTYAMNVASHVAQHGGNVLVFSLEMTEDELMDRLLSAVSGIPLNNILTGQLKEDEWHKLEVGARKLKDKNLIIIDKSGLNIYQYGSIAKKINRETPLSMVMLDHLHLVGSSNRENKTQQITEISGQAKVIAKELGCPFMLLAQLNRKCEERPDKRPRLSDLRESGSIEQDADVVAFLYRDEYYNKEDTKFPGVAEFIIGKQRNGETGTARLASQLQFSRFVNLAPSYQVPPEDKGFKYE